MAIEDGLSEESSVLSGLAAEAGSRWRRSVFEGRRVYIRDDLFDFLWRTADGRTNAERMRQGEPPHDRAGQPIELHHMLQQEPGPIAEVSMAFHKENHGILHINMMKNPSASPKRYALIRPRNAFRIPSGVDRAAFDAFRKRYWKWRASSS